MEVGLETEAPVVELFHMNEPINTDIPFSPNYVLCFSRYSCGQDLLTPIKRTKCFVTLHFRYDLALRRILLSCTNVMTRPFDNMLCCTLKVVLGLTFELFITNFLNFLVNLIKRSNNIETIMTIKTVCLSTLGTIPRLIKAGRNQSDGYEIRCNPTIGSDRILPTVIRCFTAFLLYIRPPDSSNSDQVNAPEKIGYVVSDIIRHYPTAGNYRNPSYQTILDKRFYDKILSIPGIGL